MEDGRVILKDATRYSTSSYLARLFELISGLAIRRMLGPMLMGTFSELMIIFQYTKYHHLGIFHALERELPYHNGRGDLVKVQQIKDTGFTATLFTSSLVALVLVIASLILSLDRNLIIGMRLLAITLLIQEIASFLTVLAKTHHKFTLLSKYNVYIAIFQMVVTIYLVVRFGFFGVLWASVIVGLIGLVYLFRGNFKFKLSFPFPFRETGRLLGIGAPLLIYDLVFISLMNVDRFSIIKFFGKTELGYYSIATMMAGYLFILPNLIYSVLFPRFYESFGGTGDIKRLRSFFETPTVIISYLLTGIIGWLILALPLLIKYVLPRYEAGIMAANILLLGIFFISLMGMSTYLLIALNKQRQMIGLGLFAISLAIFFNYLFIKRFHWNIEGVATAMLITYFTYSTIFIGYAFRHHTERFSHLLRFFAKVYLPFIWLVVVFYLLNSLFTYKGLTFKMDCIYLFFKSLMFLVAYIPLLYYLNKKTLILTKVAELSRFQLKIRK